MDINQTGCNPAVNPTPALFTQPDSLMFALACSGEPGAAGCGDSGRFCMNVGPRQGFRRCVYKPGVHACPDESPQKYTDRFVFYQQYEDKRHCTPCTCGVPTGSTCTAQISVYSNNTCSGNPVAEWMYQTSQGDPPGCVNLLAGGTGLESKEASPPIYTPGKCTPFGGNPIGSVVASGDVWTVCCYVEP
jgi:hypothetical protein